MDVESRPPLIQTPTLLDAQPVADRAAQELREVIDVLLRPAVSDPAVRRQGPVAPGAQHARLPRQGMCRRQPPDVRQTSSSSDRDSTRTAGSLRRRARSAHRRPPGCRRTQSSVLLKTMPSRTLRVVERLDAEMIAGAEEPACPPVPDGKGEVAQQMLDAVARPTRDTRAGSVAHRSPSEIVAAARFELANESARPSTRASAVIQTRPSRLAGCRRRAPVQPWIGAACGRSRQDRRPKSSVRRARDTPTTSVIRCSNRASTGAPSRLTMPTMPLMRALRCRSVHRSRRSHFPMPVTARST